MAMHAINYCEWTNTNSNVRRHFINKNAIWLWIFFIENMNSQNVLAVQEHFFFFSYFTTSCRGVSYLKRAMKARDSRGLLCSLLTATDSRIALLIADGHRQQDCSAHCWRPQLAGLLCSLLTATVSRIALLIADGHSQQDCSAHCWRPQSAGLLCSLLKATVSRIALLIADGHSQQDCSAHCWRPQAAGLLCSLLTATVSRISPSIAGGYSRRIGSSLLADTVCRIVQLLADGYSRQDWATPCWRLQSAGYCAAPCWRPQSQDYAAPCWAHFWRSTATCSHCASLNVN